MEIGVYRDQHHDGVVALWRAVFPDDPPWNEPRSVIRDKCEVQPELFFVATDGDAVIGTAMAGYDGHRGWVYAVAVAPSHRRQGIARALMKVAEARLTELGCVKLNLQVRADNAAVVAFYETLGYAVEERISMGKRLGRFADPD